MKKLSKSEYRQLEGFTPFDWRGLILWALLVLSGIAVNGAVITGVYLVWTANQEQSK
jgi:hypothetical protein